MKFILSYMKKHLGLVVLVMAVKLVGTFSELLIPYVLEHIIDDIAPLKQPRLIFLWGTMMVLLAVVVRFINAAANRGAVHIASKCIYSIRQDLFTRSVNLSGDQFDKVGLPSPNFRSSLTH